MPFTASDICKIIFAIILPPLGVFLERGCGADLLINICLTILGWLPGVIHAFAMTQRGLDAHDGSMSWIALVPESCLLIAVGLRRFRCLLGVILNVSTVWDACPKRWDLDCLCRTNTTSGYTLGEASFRCSLSMCSMETVFRSDLYDICDSVPGALPRTHATITATVMPTATQTQESTTTTEPSDTRSSSTSSSPLTLSSSSASTSTSASSHSSISTPTSSSSMTTSLTSSTQHSFATTETFRVPLTATTPQQLPTSTGNTGNTTSGGQSASTSDKSSKLDAGAVIGVSIASGLSGFFIVGAIIFLCCQKYRRQHQEKGRDFFEIGGVMSEPPDFAFPPVRPTGPRPMPRAPDRDSETSRLITPFEPRSQTPAVVVTGPESRHNGSYMGGSSTDRIGFAITSNSDVEASLTQSSPRTVSDLLPDKPSFGLYPEPLRWSRQNKPRPSSHATLFEEDALRPPGFIDALDQYPNIPSSSNPSQRGWPYNRVPMAGLPANPRAMLHGFGEGQDGKLAMRGPNYYGKMPAYTNSGEVLEPPSPIDVYGGLLHSPVLDSSDYANDTRQDRAADHARAAGKPSFPNAARRLFQNTDANGSSPYDIDDHFEDVDIDDKTRARESRHSGSFRPLTPVREVRTPTHEAPRWNWELAASDSGPMGLPRMPFSGAINPGQEIVSRPRIVGRDDIKRVQIRRGKPQPEGLSAPYSPDDYWPGQDSGYRSEPRACMQSADSTRSIESMRGHMPKRKPTPSERNLTPSRSGSDLILRVD
ncbi:hypothetical protein BO70DRAFT_426561 [Aspergillus heteromorphus CBS 117.55]|uniref:Uncharacterized protein n=1 Tax=Aspergillus heteromorphus CBS 117.55 TaxID=1448321 RepID=A0A317WVS3_9EURO|nr:uncharacterized protein BO70DRAFT_426561 [Aspergillus heteromorphus CBS 117.55]PWY90185.1 hypothetical protein BO70DRAFT_426561 [Aspergillus heteromorphus CBS 117.55]